MTLKDIAERAHVSISTVSRSLNDSSLVAIATKQRILEIADQSGFEFNASARALSTRQVGTIGVILPEDYDQIHINLYYSGLYNHLRRSLEREDLDLIVGFSRNHFTGVNNIQKLVRRRKVDGLILLCPYLDRESGEFLRQSGMPFVYSHYPPQRNDADVDHVYVDHENGGMLVGRLFGKRGFKKVIAFSSSGRDVEFQQRLSGFRQGIQLTSDSTEVVELHGKSTFDSGFQLATERDPDLADAEAIFALNDLMALGIVHGLQERGCQIPEDVAVVGYDDTAITGLLHPLLSTVRQPAQDVAFLTCERLIESIRDRQAGRDHVPRQIALKPHLILRATCK